MRRRCFTVNVTGAALLRPQATGEIAEVIDEKRDIRVQGFANALTVFPGLHVGQGFQVGLDAVGDFQQGVGQSN